MYSVVEITDKDRKSKAANNILRQLPEWFGIEESTVEYINKSRETDFIAAYDSEKLIGFISIKYNNQYTAEIYVMGVLQHYHKKGIGKRLLIEAEKIVKERGCMLLMVKTLGDSHPDVHYKCTREYYKKVGFYPLEEIKEIWGEENPCLLMVKSL